jgi:hypothetical protein
MIPFESDHLLATIYLRQPRLDEARHTLRDCDWRPRAIGTKRALVCWMADPGVQQARTGQRFRNSYPGARPHPAWSIDAPMRCGAPVPAHTLLSHRAIFAAVLSPEASRAWYQHCVSLEHGSHWTMRHCLSGGSAARSSDAHSNHNTYYIHSEPGQGNSKDPTRRRHVLLKYCTAHSCRVSPAHPGHYAHVDEDCLSFIILASPVTAEHGLDPVNHCLCQFHAAIASRISFPSMPVSCRHSACRTGHHRQATHAEAIIPLSNPDVRQTNSKLCPCW